MAKRASSTASELVQPKGPCNAYMWFSNDPKTKERAKETLPKEHTNKDILSKCGEMWRTMTDQDKKPYAAQAEKDKARFEKEMDAFIKAGGSKKARKSGSGGSKSKTAKPSLSSRTTISDTKKQEKKEGRGEEAKEKKGNGGQGATKPKALDFAFEHFMEAELKAEKPELEGKSEKEKQIFLKKKWDEMDESQKKGWTSAAPGSENKDALVAKGAKGVPMPASPATTAQPEGSEEEVEKERGKEDGEDEIEMEEEAGEGAGNETKDA
ncbi:hypothetical protein NSK_002710 [Nannochloropsis salina CCMP1776]|uniref:HMG box domain-containing protein n=1 Tax=Nannochloropsis salina CCMP1776 TaxID=1027361 RepID=A0A4D9D372_9STRA|nr:hypothetical protein NSK_002710 [Nannochloropsis salina CCMP1776]|eukprot:TFJ85890.1 hypothetical protein NSK_002710 [Nannochloropsis salina CCMP1776]